MKLSKKALKRAQRILNTFVIMMMLVQPVGVPGILTAMAAEGDVVAAAPAVEQAAPASDVAPAPVSEAKKDSPAPDPAPAPEVKKEVMVPVVEPVVTETAPAADVPATTPEVTPVVDAIVPAPVSDQALVVETVPVVEVAPVTGGQPETGVVTPQAAFTDVPAKDVWIKDGNKSTTADSVESGKTYVSPQNDQVTVTFTKLPVKPGKLSIEEILLMPAQVESLNALTNKAYDITSDMADGTFAYELTLPKPADQKDVQIKFAETEAGLDNAMAVSNGDMKISTEKVSAKLDHFTIFYISADTTGGAYTATTGPVLTESTVGQIGLGTIILNAPAGFEFQATSNSVTATRVNAGNCNGGGNKAVMLNGTSSQTVTPTTSTITVNITQSSAGNVNNCPGTITWSGIATRPISGTPLASGDITRTGTASIGGATFGTNTFTEQVGAVNAGNSTVVASPTAVNADNTAISTVTVTLVDSFNNPVAGKNVSLANTSGPGLPNISVASGPSDVSGIVTFTVKSGTVGTDVFTATDTSDAKIITQTASVDFVALDTTAPVITILGNNPETVALNSAYIDAGATALDNVDGDITGNILTSINVLTNSLGSGSVTYSVTDAAGNMAQVTRAVNVVDTTIPVITILGNNPETVEVNTPYIDAGATALDNVDGDITGNINVTNFVNTSIVGASSVFYDIFDSSGNWGSATRTVNVVDTTAPVVTITPGTDTIEVHSTFTDAGATWTDNYDGAGTITLATSGSLDANTVGSYVLTYTYTDASGNVGSADRNVTVQDTTAPVITLVGTDPVTIEVHTPYVDAGATASDNVDGNITANIATFNPVNQDGVGDYTVTYDVVDSHGNPATQVTRTVHVVDTTIPVISMNGTDMIIEVGAPYVDAGATALDNYDGDITANIVTVNSVDSNTVGNYIVTYNVVDAHGNVATQVTRNVTVQDTTAPTLPVATPPAGDYATAQLVTLASSDAGVGVDKIYYTLDGTTPDNASAVYGSSIAIAHDLTLKAIAYDKVGNKSTVLVAVYGIAPVITAETSNAVTETTTTITWTTNDPATSRVIYDTVSHATLGAGANYGYANSTVETDSAPKVINHSVSLSGLASGTVYYYRTVSHGSPETVSAERVLTTLDNTSGGGNNNRRHRNSSRNNNDATSNFAGANAALAAVSTNNNATGGTVEGANTSENQTPGSNNPEGGKVLGQETAASQGGFWGSSWMWLIIVLLAGSGLFWVVRRNRIA